ncbi:MAG: hypothetical protein JRG91_19250, partial [Deltaproteobacteria bacterium]|nr:hypothetical protein [Deltaproteobacteria bacterium]
MERIRFPSLFVGALRMALAAGCGSKTDKNADGDAGPDVEEDAVDAPTEVASDSVPDMESDPDAVEDPVADGVEDVAEEEVIPPECTVDDECDDSVACTADTCSDDGDCVY